MKIVDVNPFFYPYKGGIERRMNDIASRLAAKGHDVTILTGQLHDEDPEEEMMNGFRVIRLKSRKLKIYNPPFISSKGVLETLNSLDADVVNYNYRWAPSYSSALAKYDGPKVFTYHNMWGEGDGLVHAVSEMNDNRFAKNVMSSFDHIIAVSDYVRYDLLNRGYSSDYVTMVPPGLAIPVNPGSGSGDYILSLGRIVRTKGLDYLIEAMKDVDHKLIICGFGPDRKRLERAIAKAGLGDRVEMRGYVTDEERHDLMRECRFFVMPSLHESFGIAATEVMAYGRPLVCSDADGLPMTVKDAGYVVPKANSVALARAMNEMWDDDALRESKASKAVDIAMSYDWDLLLPKIENVYTKVANGEYTEKDAFKEE